MKPHESFINEFVSRLENCKISFVRGTEEFEDGVIKLDFNSKNAIADIEQLITNQLGVMGIEHQYLPMSDNCFTWLLFGKSAQTVWHIVAYKAEGKMIMQWIIQSDQ